MAKIREMLEAEIHDSGEFTRANFGLAVGDSYRDMVEDLVESTKVNGLLLLNVLMVGLGGKNIAEAMSEKAGEDGLKHAIIRNQDTFKLPFEMLYWGINIGRKLAAEEKNMLAGIDSASHDEGR